MDQVEITSESGISLARKEGLPLIRELVERSVQTREAVDNQYYPRLEAVFRGQTKQ